MFMCVDKILNGQKDILTSFYILSLYVLEIFCWKTGLEIHPLWFVVVVLFFCLIASQAKFSAFLLAGN